MSATTAEREASPDSRRFVWFGYVVGVGAGWFVVAVLLLHALKSADYDFSEQTVSELAVGRYGFLMTSAFVALGIAELTLALALLGPANS